MSYKYETNIKILRLLYNDSGDINIKLKNDKIIKVHSFILRLYTKYFDYLLNIKNENVSGILYELDFTNYSSIAIENLLKSFYGYSFDNNIDKYNAKKIIKLANLWEIKF